MSRPFSTSDSQQQLYVNVENCPSLEDENCSADDVFCWQDGDEYI
jgi:hypothetical protein